MTNKTTTKSDVIVIGSGIAGLYFALQAAEHSTVTIITKKELMESNSNYAQGGIAAVLDPLDDFQSHVNDTMIAGANINDRRAVEILVKEAPRHINKLIDLGVGFNRSNGTLALTQEGGHSKRRIVHVHDATGKEVERALIFNVRNHKNITIHESNLGLELLCDAAKSQVGGVLTLNRETKQLERFAGKFVILATGGAGHVYANTTNPRIATGDGIAMAQRLGIELQDMEFIQFHPTTLNLPGKPHFLLSEALRGEGAVLRDRNKKIFMSRYDKRKELAPRDIVSRAVFEQLELGPVYLDISHKSSEYIKMRFPYIYDQLWWYGLKLDKDLIPISPAAHYLCGGVKTNLDAATKMPGLYVIGESARTGVHGANRLASNSILECLVFAARANSSIKKMHAKRQLIKPVAIRNPKIIKTPSNIYKIRTKIQETMWNHVGIVRTTAGLEKAMITLQKAHVSLLAVRTEGTSPQIQETLNLCETGIAIAEAALNRKASVGSHYLDK